MSTIKVTNIQNPSSGTNDIQIDPSGNVTIDPLYVDAGNNRVGVGTSSPQYLTHINSTKNTTSLFITTDSVSTAADYSQIGFGNNPSGNSIFAAIRHSYDNPGAGAAGALRFFTHTGSSLQERAVIDSSGRLGIGTTTPRALLDIGGGTAFNAGTYQSPKLAVSNGYISVKSDAADGVSRLTLIGDSATGDGTIDWGGNANANLKLTSNGSERARIDSSGRLLVGTSTAASTEKVRIQASGSNDGLFIDSPSGGAGYVYRSSTSSGLAAYFIANNTQAGLISITGSSTSYLSGSDYRLKTDVRSIADPCKKLSRLKPVAFTWIADDSYGESFIAHELQEVYPHAVNGAKDSVNAKGNPVYQCIDQSKLVPLLTAALQEALAKIETLESRLTAAGI